MAASSKRSTHALPTYVLYGETGSSLGVDWLHCESIAERSRLHDWEIQPHRHAALFQILYVARGRVRVRAEDREVALAGPCLVTVPPLTVHGFGFTRDVQGTVITVQERHVQQLLAREPGLAERVLRLRCERPRAARRIAQGVQAVREEHAGTAPWRALAIDAALLALLVALGRSDGADAAQGQARADRAMTHAQRFRALVEQRYRDHAALSDYANALGITPTQLNRVCGRVLGRSALAVVHERLVLEAQRELAYTALSIKQIALDLGFADAGYFTRFFQRETGRTPTAWRQAAGRAPVDNARP